MKLPLEITYRNVVRTDALDERIRAKAAKLDQFYDRIMACRVVVDAPHRHSHKGSAYQVTVEVSVPGDELVVHRHAADRGEGDLYIALRDAFSATQRKLRAYADKRNSSISNTGLRISQALHG